MAKQILGTNCLHDVVMTKDDADDLLLAEHRNQSQDFKNVRMLWDTTYKHLKDWAASTPHAQFWFVMDEGKRIFSSSHSVSPEFLQSEAQKVSQFTTHDLPSMDSLRHSLAHSMRQQGGEITKELLLSVLNSIPSIDAFIQAKDTRDPLWTARQMVTPRTRVAVALRGNVLTETFLADIFAERLVAQSSHRIATSNRLSSSRQRTHQGRMKRMKRGDNTMPLRAPIFDDVDYAESQIWNQTASASTRSLVSGVRSSLMKYGVCRMLRNDDKCIEVAWNAYDAKTGHLFLHKYAITRVNFIHGHNPVFMCQSCSSYQHSVQIAAESDDDGEVVGFCAHTNLLGILVPHFRKADVPAMKDDFVLWALRGSSARESVTNISSSAGMFKFFVHVTDSVARAERTAETATCVIWLNSDCNRLSCSVSRCTDRTMKKVKLVKDPSELCCHLRKIFEHDEYKSLWNPTSFDVASSKDMDALIEGVTGW
jgi:hypothetical protein